MINMTWVRGHEKMSTYGSFSIKEQNSIVESRLLRPLPRSQSALRRRLSCSRARARATECKQMFERRLWGLSHMMSTMRGNNEPILSISST